MAGVKANNLWLQGTRLVSGSRAVGSLADVRKRAVDTKTGQAPSHSLSRQHSGNKKAGIDKQNEYPKAQWGR